MNRILMIDDDVALTELVKDYLQLDGFEFDASHDGPAGLERAKSQQHDLLLLDVMLPGMDGFSLLQQLRKTSNCPVLMLTARGDEIDRIVGLELGADDYLAKPFNPRELVARIKAIFRRIELVQQNKERQVTTITVHDLQLDSASHQLTVQQQLVQLTATEFQLLDYLMRRMGQVISKEELSKQVLGRSLQLHDRSLDMHLSNIRRKLAQHSAQEYIQTLRGSGFRFVPESDPC
ncbi:response regulator transcription factor [Alkalimonas amylolytica]|uniref:Two-component system, OmpR family, response regulator CpxR n=1 Tax=Alkalimonas amylolytica TaxID=152573 RepID=A0A1H3Y135_ALKAM|nr:response regulator transcription factor [Alkalimonas amylolytica]SEA05316.1 two-component system, OmpR family, response regulator CpxR [Alkalimonas amylolytica]